MNYALIYAGGVGKRMNSKSKPKQFLEVHEKPIIISTIEHFENHPDIDEICLVCSKEWIEYSWSLINKFNIKKVKHIVSGGETAVESQYNGLTTIYKSSFKTKEDIVLLHDGVRPLIDEKTISACIAMVKKKGSAITVVPASETIITTGRDDEICSTVPRAECRLARAPQCYYLDDVLGVFELAKKDEKLNFVDSCSLMMYYGRKLYTVEGECENIKVTTPADFYIYRALLDAKEDSQILGL